METIQITSDELSKMQELGRGACSIVYKYDNDLVIKVLNEKGIELHNEDEFFSIIGMENSTWLQFSKQCFYPFENTLYLYLYLKAYACSRRLGIVRIQSAETHYKQMQ